MNDVKIPEDNLYGELIQLTLSGCVEARHDQVIDLYKWKNNLAIDRSNWRSQLQAGLKVGAKSITTALENKRRLQNKLMKTANLVVAKTGINGINNTKWSD